MPLKWIFSGAFPEDADREDHDVCRIHLSGRRLFTELRQILEEENPVPAISRLSDYHLLQFIHPSIVISKQMAGLLNSVKKVVSWFDLLFLEESYNKWVVYFLALIRGCDIKTSSDICARFELKPELAKLFTKDRLAAETLLFGLERRLPRNNSQLYKELAVFKTELVLYMMAAAKNKKVEKAVSFYFTKLRRVDISIKGRDLISLGLQPGPMFRDVMDAVMDGKLNGRLKTREEELDFAHKVIKKFKN